MNQLSEFDARLLRAAAPRPVTLPQVIQAVNGNSERDVSKTCAARLAALVDRRLVEAERRSTDGTVLYSATNRGLDAVGIKLVRAEDPAPEPKTLWAARIAELIREYGSQAEVARALKISEEQVRRLRLGMITTPTDEMLQKLGIRRVMTYERISP